MTFRILACVALLAFAYLGPLSAPAAARAHGAVEAIRLGADGGAVIVGWACEPGQSRPAAVQLYAGGPASAGQPLAIGVADGESAVAARDCAGTRHGFAIPLSRSARFRYGGLRLYAYAGVQASTVGELAGLGREVLPPYRPVPDAARRCVISDIASLAACFAEPTAHDVFAFTRDLTCTNGQECCGAGGSGFIRLHAVASKVIEGNGHTIHRAAGRACPAIALDHVRGVLVEDLVLDEDLHLPPCELNEKPCADTVDVTNSTEVNFNGLRVYAGKGIAVKAWATDGFAISNSVIADAGIIGLDVSHFKYGVSRNVVIADSIIAHSRTNGIVIGGAIGTPEDPVLIVGNVLSDNHWHGLWPVARAPGGVTSGGQLLVGDGANIRVTENLISGGHCENCNPEWNDVTAIEISNQPAPPGGVHALRIDHNILLNGAGVAIYQNPGMLLSGASIIENRLTGYRYLDEIKAPAEREGNLLHPIRARPQLAMLFAPAPRAGAPWRPILRCVADDRGFVSTERDCGSTGRVDAVLGFSLAPTDPGAKSFFACAASHVDRFLSWDPKCEGHKSLGQLGYAIPRSTPTPAAATNP
jgi:hypothetical protein